MDYSRVRKMVMKFFETDGSDLMKKYGRSACEKTAQAIVDLYEKYEREGHEGAGGEPFRPWIVSEARKHIESNFKPVKNEKLKKHLDIFNKIDNLLKNAPSGYKPLDALKELFHSQSDKTASSK